MRRLVIGSILVYSIICLFGCDLWIAGSKKTGFRIEIETNQIGFNDLQKIEEILKDNDYEVVFREKKMKEHGAPRYPSEVYTMFTKILKSRKNEPVDVYLLYVKDELHNLIRHPFIKIQNWFVGGIVPEITSEINDTSNLIYNELASKVGKENVTMKRFGKNS